MTTVYRIAADPQYQKLVVQTAASSSQQYQLFDCTSLIDSPTLLTAEIVNPEGLCGDLWYVEGGALAIASGQSELEEILGIAGETLLVSGSSGTWLVLNVLECLNNLDSQKTQWRDGQIERYAFHPRRFTVSSLFKIPETCEREILVLERNKEPDDEFKAAVESQALTGIVFEQLWENAEE